MRYYYPYTKAYLLLLAILFSNSNNAAEGSSTDANSKLFSVSSPKNDNNNNQDNNKQKLRRRRTRQRQEISSSSSTFSVAAPDTNQATEQEQQTSKQQKEVGREEELLRFFVQVHNENGKDHVIRTSHEVLRHLEDDHLMVVRTNNVGLEALQSHKDIKFVEKDNPVWGLSIGSKSPPSHGRSRRPKFQSIQRKLQQQQQQQQQEERTPYGIPMIQADQLDMGTENPVSVCIIDSGVAINHPDLDSSIISGDDNNRPNLINGNNDTLRWDHDLGGHGTEVAGIISSMIGNGEGVRGVGNIRLHITRGLDDRMTGYESDVLHSLRQCIYRGAKIITLSLGGTETSSYMSSVYSEVVNRYGVMLFSASGNEGSDSVTVYPAAHPDAISVGAIDDNRNRAWFSNYNDQVEFVAPGINVPTTSVSETAIFTNNYGYPAYKIGIGSNHPNQVEGEMINCGSENAQCQNAAAQNKVCFIQQNHSNLQLSVNHCENGGGQGAIIFWDPNTSTEIRKWHYVHSSIPVVAIDTTSGLEILSSSISSSSSSSQTIRIGFSNTHSNNNDDHDNNERQYTYTYKSGTSIACPYVAAAAAKLWSHFPTCTNYHIRYALAITASHPNNNNDNDNVCDNQFGYGIIQIHDAYQYIMENPCNDSWPVNQSKGGCSTV